MRKGPAAGASLFPAKSSDVEVGAFEAGIFGTFADLLGVCCWQALWDESCGRGFLMVPCWFSVSVRLYLH